MSIYTRSTRGGHYRGGVYHGEQPTRHDELTPEQLAAIRADQNVEELSDMADRADIRETEATLSPDLVGAVPPAQDGGTDIELPGILPEADARPRSARRPGAGK